MRGALVVIVLTACGDNIAVTGPYNGKRLQVAYETYEDGGKQIAVGVAWDDQRHEACTPRRWSDGFTYCTPEAVTGLFLDEGCLHEVGAVTDEKYVIHTFFLDGQVLPSKLYAVGDPIAAPPAVYLHGASCFEVGLPKDATFVTLGDLVADVPHVVIEEPPAASRIGQAYITSDDGLRAPGALRDRTLGVTCVPDELPDAPAATCAPVGAVTASLFHDSGCFLPEAVVIGDPPDILRVPSPDGCSTYAARGDEVFTQLAHHLTDDGTCGDQLIIGDESRQFLAGEPLELGTLPRVRTDTGHRIVPIELGAYFGTHAFDRQLGVECSPLAIGASRRCVPATVPVIQAFADAQCATAIDIADVPMRTCDPAVAFARDGDRFFAIGAASPARYQLTTGDTCYLLPVASGHQLRELGAAIPVETFAAATLGP